MAAVSPSDEIPSRANDVTSSLEKKLRCAVCEGLFDVDQHKPRLLRCRHSICEACLLNLLKESSIIPCGRCLVKTRVHGVHVDALEVDECIEALVQFLTPEKPSPSAGTNTQDITQTLRALRSSVNSRTEDPDGNGEGSCDICNGCLRNESPFEFPLLDKSALFTYPCGHQCHRNCAVRRAKDIAASRADGRIQQECHTMGSGPGTSGIAHGSSEAQGRENTGDPSVLDHTLGVTTGNGTNGTPDLQGLVFNPAESHSMGQTRGDSVDDDTDSLDPVMNPILDKLAVAATLSIGQGEDRCAVCQRKLKSKSPYRDGVVADRRSTVSLLFCDHLLHHHCAVKLLENQPGDSSIQCPCCKQPLGIKFGNQPDGGKMVIHLQRNRMFFSHLVSLPGFPNTDTIVIEYHYKAGIQGRNHPSPGQRFEAYGFPRIAYLPLTPKGYKVLCMLKIAFDRRLTFTIGTSSTTGLSNCVVWAEIPHKTSTAAGSHGYPDPNYLNLVTEKLKEVGVTPADIPDDPSESLGIGFDADGSRLSAARRESDMEFMMWMA